MQIIRCACLIQKFVCTVFITIVRTQDTPVNTLHGNLLKRNKSKRTNMKKDKN